MSVHNANKDLYKALIGEATIRDPGTGNAIDVRGINFGVCRGFGAGTYKLPNMTAEQIGTTVFVIADAAQTWQNAAASTLQTLASGEVAMFTAVTTSTWRAGKFTNAAADALAYDGNDSGVNADADTVESALDSLYIPAGNLFVPIPLYSLRIMSTMAVGTLVITDATPDTGGAGLIGSTTTPVLEPINGATAGCQRLRWASSNNTVVGFQVPLPADLDDARAITLSARIASGGTTDAVGFTLASYFGETGAAVADTTGTNQTTTYSTVTATIAAADVVPASTLTISLTPVAHTADAMDLSALWLTIPRTVLAP
jgi:hypothetical protein